MPERGRALSYLKHVGKNAAGFGAAADYRRELLPETLDEPLSTTDLPKAFQDLVIDTSGIPNVKPTARGKFQYSGLQFFFPAFYRTTRAFDRRINEDLTVKQKIFGAIATTVSILPDAADFAAMSAMIGNSVHDGDLRWAAGSLVVRGVYNVGVQVVPDAIRASFRRKENVVFDAKSRIE